MTRASILAQIEAASIPQQSEDAPAEEGEECEEPFLNTRLMQNRTVMPVPVVAGKPEWTDTRVREVVNLGLGMAAQDRSDAQRLSAGERLIDPRLNRLVLRCIRNDDLIVETKSALSAGPLSPKAASSAADGVPEPEEEEATVSETEMLRQQYFGIEQELEAVWEMRVVSPMSPRSPSDRRGSGSRPSRRGSASSFGKAFGEDGPDARYLRNRVTELESREATVEQRTRALIAVAHRFVYAENADVTTGQVVTQMIPRNLPDGLPALKEGGLEDGQSENSPLSDSGGGGSKLPPWAQQLSNSVRSDTRGGSPDALPRLQGKRPRVVAFEATETMETEPCTTTSGLWVKMKENEAQRRENNRLGGGSNQVPGFDQSNAEKAAGSPSKAAEDFLEQKRQRDAAKAVGKASGKKKKRGDEPPEPPEAAEELAEKESAEPDSPRSPVREVDPNMFEKKPKKPARKAPPLPNSGMLDAMLTRAKHEPPPEVEEEPSPRSKGKKGLERLKTQNVILAGANAARKTIRSNSLPDKKDSVPDHLKDRRVSTLSEGMDPLPDDLPEDVVQDQVQQAFTTVLEAPVPLNPSDAVNLVPRYRAFCEKYNVKTNSGVLNELERVVRHDGAKRITGSTTTGKTSYNFAHCNLGDRGVAPILLSLCHDRQRPLKVNLRDCGLHTTGCYIVAGFLRHPSLVTLDMSDNPVSLTSGEMLVAAIEQRSPLSPEIDLRLERTYVTRQGKKPVVGYPCGHRTNLRSRYSMVATSLGRARSPSPDGSEKSDDNEKLSSKKSEASSATAYNRLRNQIFNMTTG